MITLDIGTKKIDYAISLDKDYIFIKVNDKSIAKFCVIDEKIIEEEVFSVTPQSNIYQVKYNDVILSVSRSRRATAIVIANLLKQVLSEIISKAETAENKTEESTINEGGISEMAK